MSRNVLMIDNHDSFTFNIVEALGRLGASVRTAERDAVLPRYLRLPDAQPRRTTTESS